MRDELRANRYEFGRYRGQPVRKKADARRDDIKAWRPISIASIRDRVVQRAILDRIWPDIRKRVHTDTSYGGIRRYRVRSGLCAKVAPEEDPRRCVGGAAQRVLELREQGYEWVFETDIESFFPSIDRTRLFGELLPLLRDDSVSDLIRAFLDTSVANAEELGNLAGLWDPERGVPQGGVLSPTLANFYLFEHDKSLTEAGFRLIRYVDDLIVMTRTYDEAAAAHSECKTLLAKTGLSIHPLGEETNGRVKTNIRAPGEPFDFLGLRFAARSIRPTPAKFESLRERLLQMTETEGNNWTLVDVIQRLNWCVTGWVKAYAFCNLTEEDLALIDGQVRKFVRRWLQRRGIIVKEKQLDHRAYRWLGIRSAQSVHIQPILRRKAARRGPV